MPGDSFIRIEMGSGLVWGAGSVGHTIVLDVLIFFGGRFILSCGACRMARQMNAGRRDKV